MIAFKDRRSLVAIGVERCRLDWGEPEIVSLLCPIASAGWYRVRLRRSTGPRCGWLSGPVKCDCPFQSADQPQPPNERKLRAVLAMHLTADWIRAPVEFDQHGGRSRFAHNASMAGRASLRVSNRYSTFEAGAETVRLDSLREQLQPLGTTPT